ncbi:MAG: hypothetical protein Fur0025_37690 [Oscillatoriaceae cyanobacterium]
MNQKLNGYQLEQIVAEVERLNQNRQDELNREQVQEILRELNLPDDLLDEALVQVQQRAALAQQKRRNLWLGVGAIAGLVVILAGGGLWMYGANQQIAGISSYEDSLSLAVEKDRNIREINRQEGPEVYYHVTLQNAPLGRTLSLRCDWLDPTGQIAHQNRYETREIDKPVWPTYCRYRFPTGAQVGQWEVRLLGGERLISSETFIVK